MQTKLEIIKTGYDFLSVERGSDGSIELCVTEDEEGTLSIKYASFESLDELIDKLVELKKSWLKEDIEKGEENGS